MSSHLLSVNTQNGHLKPKQARALVKRAALLKAGIYEFSHAGFAGATTKSIAERANVATGTFYLNFKNKESLLREIARQRIDDLKGRIDSLKSLGSEKIPVEKTINEILGVVYDFHSHESELHQVLEERKNIDPDLRIIMDEGEEKMLNKILFYISEFDLEEPEVIASNLFAMIEAIVHRHVFECRQFSREKVISQGAKMLSAFFN